MVSLPSGWRKTKENKKEIEYVYDSHQLVIERCRHHKTNKIIWDVTDYDSHNDPSGQGATENYVGYSGNRERARKMAIRYMKKVNVEIEKENRYWEEQGKKWEKDRLGFEMEEKWDKRKPTIGGYDPELDEG